MSNFELVGIDIVFGKLDALVGTIRSAAAGAAYEEGEVEMTISKRQVPVDFGTLRSTGHVEKPVWQGDIVTVGLGYGGPAGPGFPIDEVGYAVYVHENLDAHHPVGKAKYLEDPMREEVSSGRASDRMGKSIERRLP